MEHKRLKSKAIVLKEREIGEVDKLFTVFTKDFGKIEVLGKGIQKIKAKLRGGLQVLNYILLEFIQGKTFNIATDAIFKNEFLNLKSSFRNFRSSFYICYLLDKLIKGEQKDERIWNLLLETLKNLQLTTYNLQLIVRYFEWNLLSYLGFKPELYFCTRCHKKIKKGKFFFSAKDGGVLCEDCKKKYEKEFEDKIGQEIRKISKDAIKILRLIISQDREILKKLKVTSQQKRELKEISNFFLSRVAEEEIFVV